MSTLHLKIRAGCEEPYVEFHVDGEDLGARIKAAFGEEGFDDVLPWWGIDYRIEDTLLGDLALRDGARKAIMFACGCGCSACSSIWADVTVDGDTITLSNFSTWRHGQDIFASLGPVSFDRQQFESAIANLRQEVAEWRPPPPKIKEQPRVFLTPPPPEKEPRGGS